MESLSSWMARPGPAAGLLHWRPSSGCVGGRPLPQRRQEQQFALAARFRPARCQKMFVPGFGEASPEAEAAKNLQHFFTFVAVKIVLGQLQVVPQTSHPPPLPRLVYSLEGLFMGWMDACQSYNPEAHAELNEFVARNSLNDGDKFCNKLMRESPRHQALALRILEVRSAYQRLDFEWENLRKLAFKMVEESNTKLMREYIEETTSHMDDDT